MVLWWGGERISNTEYTYVDHLIFDDDQAKELMELLDEKYKVKSQRGLDLILERVKDGLQAKMRMEVDENCN